MLEQPTARTAPNPTARSASWPASGDRLPGGGTLLTPLGVTVTETGDIYLAAQLTENGREFVALYVASPI